MEAIGNFFKSLNPMNQAMSMMQTIIMSIIAIIVIILVYKWATKDSFEPDYSPKFVCDRPPCGAQPIVAY